MHKFLDLIFILFVILSIIVLFVINRFLLGRADRIIKRELTFGNLESFDLGIRRRISYKIWVRIDWE